MNNSSDEEYVDKEEEEVEEELTVNDNASDATSETNFIASDGNGTYQPETGEESTEHEITQRRTRSATRQCSAKTNEKISQIIRKEEMTEKQALGGVVQDVDKEYLADIPSEDDEDDSGNAKDESRLLKARKRKRRKVIFDSEDGEESSDHHSEGGEDKDELQYYHYRSPRKRKARTQGKRNIKAKRACRTLLSDFDDRASDRSDWGEKDETQKRQAHAKVLPTHFQAKYSHSPSKLRTVKCPSIKDELTKMDLPKGRPHVCCIISDGKSRHCYTLDTLYRVAISKHHGCSSNPVQFLQPPDFRFPMEDDLIDQISSRFGRPALDIEQSAAYKEMQRMDSRDHFRSYLNHFMGSTDLYCCPICYSEAYRRQGNLVGGMEYDDDDESEGDDDEKESGNDPFLFRDDPMTILGNVGMKTASTFCFRLQSGVKNHVKVVHGVDPSVMKGNHLFNRFQIRASDGLLQQWLATKRCKNMWAYWASDGGGNSNSESFLGLSSLINEGQLKGEQSGEYGSVFSRSFPNRAEKVWNKLSEPYLKPQYDGMKDMINDECVHEGVKPRPVFDDQEPNFEERFNEHLRQKNQQLGNDDASDEAEEPSASASSSSSSGAESANEAEDEEGGESIDPWMEAKTERPTAARRRNRSNSQDSDDESLFENLGSCSSQNRMQPTASNIVSPQRRILDNDGES